MFSVPVHLQVILWSRLCLAKDEFRYHRWHVYLILFIWFCYLEWMIYGGKLTSVMWSTNVENILSRWNSFGLGPHCCQQNKHIPLKNMIIWTTCKAVDCFSNIARVKYSIVTSRFTSTSTFITLVKSIQTSHQPTRTRSEKTIWRLEIILRLILILKRARNIPQ